MVWIPSKVSYYDDSVLDTYTPFITAYHGPSGHKGHSILKKDSSTTHRARSLDTSSDFDPTMGDYHSYRTTRTSYDDHDDDFVSSKNRNLHRLASDTLDDNDEIARRSRRHDQKLLNQITNKLDIYDAPLPHPRSHTGSTSSKKTSTHTNNKRSYRRLPAAPTATVVGTSAALPTYLDASRRRYTEVLGPDTEINRRVDALVDYDMPRALKSLSSVRDHMNEIKGGMGTHRMLIDRYLTLDLGPSQEVDYAVAQKYYELAARMPELEPDKYHRKALYADDSGVNLSSQRARSVGNIHHYGQFSQPVSETRNRLRKVITKARRDPTFYSY